MNIIKIITDSITSNPSGDDCNLKFTLYDKHDPAHQFPNFSYRYHPSGTGPYKSHFVSLFSVLGAPIQNNKFDIFLALQFFKNHYE